MQRRFERADRDGWRLYRACASVFSSVALDELTERIVTEVARGNLEPMRRSRRGRTFRLRFKARDGIDLDVFIKVIDAERGFDRIKRWVRGSTAAHIARLTDALDRAGFAVPLVLLHGTESAGGRELVASPRAKGDGPLRMLMSLAGSPAHKRALMRALGATVARLHQAGFVHGDLTPFNVFVLRGEPPHFTLLDHDRTRRAFSVGRRRRQLRNLVQLGRFELPGVSRTDRMRVLYGYAGEMERVQRKALIRRVEGMLEKRVGRDGFEQVKPLPGLTTG